MFLKRHFLFSAFVFAASIAQGSSLPSALRGGASRFISRALGSACYTMDSVERGLPCNPASVAKDRESRFDADLLMGSHMKYIQEAQDILGGNDSPEAVSKFFSHRDTVEGEASFEASFQTSTWGLGVEPYRFIAVTRMQNPALPMVDVIIAQEQSVRTQLASYVGENFYAGVQARYTHVKFIGEYFALTEAFAGDKDELFVKRTQDLVYLEPGFLFAWEEQPWKPQISAVLANWGYSSEKTDEYPIQPEGLLGASIKPFVPLGLLELGIQFQINSETQNARDAFRAAMAYKLGILQLIASASDYDRSAGFTVTFRSFSSGLSYWDQDDSRGVFISFLVTL